MNYKDFHLVTNRRDFVNLVRKPHFMNAHILDENLMIVETRKKNVVLNKPRYLGQAILDDAKASLCVFFFLAKFFVLFYFFLGATL